MGDDMHIYESAENYLEAILALSEHGAVRSIDVAQQLSVSKPSVSRAMSLLRENGYVLMDKDGFLTLTDTGLEIAQRIYERHRLLSKWLDPWLYSMLYNGILCLLVLAVNLIVLGVMQAVPALRARLFARQN